jgi:hypothetical protein
MLEMGAYTEVGLLVNFPLCFSIDYKEKLAWTDKLEYIFKILDFIQLCQWFSSSYMRTERHR